jgi:hypothetical protein
VVLVPERVFRFLAGIVAAPYWGMISDDAREAGLFIRDQEAGGSSPLAPIEKAFGIRI